MTPGESGNRARPARPTLLLLMACVIVAAIDFAWARFFFANKRSMLGFQPMGLDFGAIPFVILLVHAGLRRFRVRPFASGFLAAGLIVQVAYLIACHVSPWLVQVPLEAAYHATMSPGLEAEIDAKLRLSFLNFRFSFAQIGWVTILLLLPQLAVSVLAGLVVLVRSRRKLRIIRSEAQSAVPPGDRPGRR